MNGSKEINKDLNRVPEKACAQPTMAIIFTILEANNKTNIQVNFEDTKYFITPLSLYHKIKFQEWLLPYVKLKKFKIFLTCLFSVVNRIMITLRCMCIIYTPFKLIIY